MLGPDVWNALPGWVTLFAALASPPPEREGRAPCGLVSEGGLVYGIGSSSMGQLGPMLRATLKPWGVRFAHWAKHSTGIARPDYFDWLPRIREIRAQARPSVWVYVVGGNDNQPLRYKGESGHWRWAHMQSNRWQELYAARVDALLAAMSPQGKEAIFWVSPMAFEGERARQQQPLIHKLMRERVEAFPGQAFYVDVYQHTITRRGDIVYRFSSPGDKRHLKARGADGVHLSEEAMERFVASPIKKLLGRCLGQLAPELRGAARAEHRVRREVEPLRRATQATPPPPPPLAEPAYHPAEPPGG
jgi:hypothetical protein